jgi:predicted nucleic acid-binding Zn ribbon protein
MSEPDAAGNSPREPPDEPVDDSIRDHDPTGLGLARSMARSMARPGRGRRRPRTPADQTRSGSAGAHPDDRDPKLLGAALERLVESKGWTTEIGVHSLLARWPSLVGPGLAGHSHPESYANSVLTVRTDSTAWASQLRALAPNLVAVLNHRLGDGTVTLVRVLGPDAPSWKRGKRSVRDGRGPRDTYG